MSALAHKSILLVITGGIAAYKIPALIRLLRKEKANVTCLLTKGGAQFVTPLTLQSLSENKVYSDLWSLTDEHEMGHIELSRAADLILVAPASANFIAKIANGMANDLASTCLLARDAPIMMAPAMNGYMWGNTATQDNIKTLTERGMKIISPDTGDMACGETGQGRMPEPEALLSHMQSFFESGKPLAGKTALVTAGPTHEPIDPVRYIANRSSGKQGYAIAEALRDAGADVTLVTGPTYIDPPKGMETVSVNTAEEMYTACMKALPTDIAICTAAVADWHVDGQKDQKLKKQTGQEHLSLSLSQNPDILADISKSSTRPALVIGFAAETENAIQNAHLKRRNKGCDWIIVNEVSKQNPAFDTDQNSVNLITAQDEKSWDVLPKTQIASLLVKEITTHFYDKKPALKAV